MKRVFPNWTLRLQNFTHGFKPIPSVINRITSSCVLPSTTIWHLPCHSSWRNIFVYFTRTCLSIPVTFTHTPSHIQLLIPARAPTHPGHWTLELLITCSWMCLPLNSWYRTSSKRWTGPITSPDNTLEKSRGQWLVLLNRLLALSVPFLSFSLALSLSLSLSLSDSLCLPVNYMLPPGVLSASLREQWA